DGVRVPTPTRFEERLRTGNDDVTLAAELFFVGSNRGRGAGERGEVVDAVIDHAFFTEISSDPSGGRDEGVSDGASKPEPRHRPPYRKAHQARVYALGPASSVKWNCDRREKENPRLDLSQRRPKQIASKRRQLSGRAAS